MPLILACQVYHLTPARMIPKYPPGHNQAALAFNKQRTKFRFHHPGKCSRIQQRHQARCTLATGRSPLGNKPLVDAYSNRVSRIHTFK
jgi:hypothetical protein